ncbi:hypothetical protein XH90_33035 [Bradyrhizobium sp. CCBAU 53338]|nr:hypothetical protein XH90_33035 [Bradyrhizobium sp. CCBAU 53338]
MTRIRFPALQIGARAGAGKQNGVGGDHVVMRCAAFAAKAVPASPVCKRERGLTACAASPNSTMTKRDLT